jgi:branched-chain amino acid transport system ATP-binding protein
MNRRSAPSVQRPAVDPASTALRVDGVSIRYGDAIHAVTDVSIDVRPGEIVGLLGANGAGKSSLLNAISGLVPLHAGTISVGDTVLGALNPQARARFVAHVPEGRQVFGQHTVGENLALAAFDASRAERKRRLTEVEEVLPALTTLHDRQARLLSGGQQQMVALGRGLMSRAPVLMIDELSLGLAPAITDQFASTLLELRAEGYAILLVEQYLTLALRVCDRVFVLDRGAVVLSGPTAAIRSQLEALEEVYLGTAENNFAEADDTVAQEQAGERLSVGAPTVRPGNPMLAALAAVVGIVASFFPWFDIAPFGGPVTTETGWALPLLWPLLPVVGAAGVAAVAALRIVRHEPLPLVPALVGAGLAIAALATLFTRTWLLGRGLADPGIEVDRRWGLLVGLYATALMTVGAISLVLEATSAKRFRDVVGAERSEPVDAS